jgi:hypothetical protein
VSGDRCPGRASERPGVRRPCVPASACAADVRSGRAAVGRSPHGWDGRGRRGRPLHPRPARGLPESEPGAGSWRRPCWAAEGRFGLGRRRGRWLGGGQVDRVADQDRPGAREDRSSVGSRGPPPAAGCAARHTHHCCSEPAQDRAPTPDVELGIGSATKPQGSGTTSWLRLEVATTLRGRRCGLGRSRLIAERLPGLTGA